LTIKFTRCTASSAVSRSPLGEPLSTWTQSHRANSTSPVCSSHAYPIARITYPSRLIGTHKNLLRLVICPIYSVVKYRLENRRWSFVAGR
jgi:hypothetical protein